MGAVAPPVVVTHLAELAKLPIFVPLWSVPIGSESQSTGR